MASVASVIRLALALEVTADELLGMTILTRDDERKTDLKLIRRLQKIETLPSSQKRALLKTMDTYFKASEK